MNIKNAVLKRLEENRGNYVSGEIIAEESGVSRQSVSKAVGALKADGYKIDAVKNRGYMLDSGCDKISASLIADRTGARVFVYDCVSSTNEYAKKHFLDIGECIVVGNAQTEGKKKDGGRFYSPKDKGIYFSIATPVDLPFKELETLRRVCGKACAEVIAATCSQDARTVRIDEVYIGDKKVCGILTECSLNAATERVDCAVIGIGIYTSETCFADTALASVFPDDTRNNMIADIYLKIKGLI